jgi:hypothetical protein
MTDLPPELLKPGPELTFPAELRFRDLRPAYTFGSSLRLSVNGIHFVEMLDFPHGNGC